MKNSIKKFMTLAMLLSFMTTPVATSLAVAADNELLAYSMDYMPEIRGSQPSVVSLNSPTGISKKNPPISLSLRDSDVQQVLRMFADKAGLNIIFKGDVKGNVTMDLVNTPLNSAFDLVLASNDLSYTLKDNTLIITNADEASSVGKQEMAVIPVKYVNAAQAAHFINSNIYSMKKPGLSSNMIAASNPATNEVIIFGGDNDVRVARNVIAQIDKKPVVTSFKVNHTTPAQMADMICTLLLPGTGSFIPKSTGGAAGVVTGGAAGDTSTAIELGSGTIACSSAITNFAKNTSSRTSSKGENKQEASEVVSLQSFGITVAYYTQLGTISVTGATPQQVDMIKEFIATNDRRQPQAYLEFSIIELNETGSREFNNEWSFISKHFAFNYSGGTTEVKPTRVLGHGYRPTYGAITAVDSEGTAIAWNSHPSLIYSLNLLLKNGKGRTISNPRIVVTNGQESVIDLTEDYIKTVTSQIVQGSYSNVPTVERTYEIGDDMGLKITVTPFISPDGYVYLNVKPNYATLKKEETTTNELGQEDLAATLLRRSDLELKNIRIKDGDTLVIGGMMKEVETKSVGKVPFFGDIPGLGMLFRSSSTNREKYEMVILITPKIISDNDTPSNEGTSTL